MIVFAFHVLLALIFSEHYRWQALNDCFEAGIDSLKGPPVSFIAKLSQLTQETNQILTNVFTIESHLEGPEFLGDYSAGGSAAVTFHLRWKHTLSSGVLEKLDFGPFEENYKCGVQRLCENQKCTHNLIADKF